MAIATLIAAGRLDDRLVGEATALVPGARFERWIDEGDAAEIHCEGDVHDLRAAFEHLAGVDAAVIPGPRVEARLFVADMDSTIIGQECIDELADYAGVRDKVAEVTERAMRGELEFGEALEMRVALLEGLDTELLHHCRDARIRPNPGASTLVATLNAHGVATNLVSGGFEEFVRPTAEALGFHGMLANSLGQAGGRLDGTTTGALIDGAAKRRFAEELLDRFGVPADALVAIGDGANDVRMIELAGLGIGYRPKPALDAAANAAIRHHDLTAVLWMIGIPKKDWVISR